MATRRKWNLKPFNVTKRSTAGKVNHQIFPRVSNTSEEVLNQEDSISNVIQEDSVIEDVIAEEILPTLYEVNQKKAVENWEKIRFDLLRTVIESESLPLNQYCSICVNQKATHRCLQCGHGIFFCLQCYDVAHSKTNIFHTGEVMENGVFTPIVKTRYIDARNHECSSTSWVPLCCISENGKEIQVQFASCSCEPLVVTMVRAHLWPSSPQRPYLAFSFELLDWTEALLLEAQVSLNDFCKALYFKCNDIITKRKDIYSTLIDAFEEYRWLKVELRHLSFVCPELDKGNICPACPKESGICVLSMDALFGLPRKKAAGVSHRDALHGSLFFGNQTAVDEHVALYQMPKQKVSQACSNFLAGDTLRSCRRYRALDETAIFGCACRHEFPLFYINLKHGERLSYVVWVLNELVPNIPSGIEVYVMYDIACTLVQHLRNRSSRYLLERVHFALPSFHAYSHNASCQAQYGPMNCSGVGLSDGEVMERLWSYLRRFARMTKEMRPAHRVDVLTHALLYYASSSKRSLPTLLCTRWKRAAEMSQVVNQQLESLCSSLSVPVTDVMIEEWIEAYKEAILNTNFKKQPIHFEWKRLYFVILQSYYFAREEISKDTLNEPACNTKLHLSRLDSQLSEIEKKHDVTSRWKQSDRQYEEMRAHMLEEKKASIRTTLWSCVVKRHYLLRMKAKYAEGQKIAKKLCSGIAKETRMARRLLDEYSTALLQLSSDNPLPSLQEVLSLQSKFWSQNATSSVKSTVPWKVREEIIHTHVMKKRCKEEMEMLRTEMLSTVKYWWDRIDCILRKIQEYESLPETLFNNGVIGFLRQLMHQAQLQHHKSSTKFGLLIELPSTTTVVYDIQSSVGNGSDSESESDWDSETEDTDSD